MKKQPWIRGDGVDRKEFMTILGRRRCAELGLENVEIVTGTVTDTHLPDKALDLVVMVNVVHCLADPIALLKNVAASLKTDGQVAVVEGNLDKDPSAAGEWFSRARLLGIFDAAGYVLVRQDASLPQDNIYLLKKREQGSVTSLQERAS